MGKKRYEITEVQDVSRPSAKRFVAHITVSAVSKPEILEIIKEVTQQIRNDNDKYCLPNTVKKFGNSPAHVVRLYVHAENGNLIVQSMWVDYEAKDVILPKPLTYNDEIEGYRGCLV
jgi:hypothetical protein